MCVVLSLDGAQDVVGLVESESVGRSIKMIEGPLTQQSTLLSLYEAVSSGITIECQLTTYHADGRPFINHLRVVPVKVRLESTLLMLPPCSTPLLRGVCRVWFVLQPPTVGSVCLGVCLVNVGPESKVLMWGVTSGEEAEVSYR